jgi:hypothetical protein
VLLPALGRFLTVTEEPAAGTAKLCSGAGPSVFWCPESAILARCRQVPLSATDTAHKTMKEPKPQVANAYTQEGEWPGLAAYRELAGIWFSSALGPLRGALTRSLSFLGGRFARGFEGRSCEAGAPSPLILTLDKTAGSLNLTVANRSQAAIWAEEAQVDFVDVETDGETCAPAPAILKIRKLVAPSESLQASVTDAVYSAAGRRQGVYSCTISPVLRYRRDEADQEQFEISFPSYRVSMVALVPISVRRMGQCDKPAKARASQTWPAREGDEPGRCRRRSQRMNAQLEVVIEGQCSDGSPFSCATRALVLSAHGCLVTVPDLFKIGELVMLRNVSTLREQRCEVVYIGLNRGAGIEVGLGFETEAPDFWGITCLPSIGRGNTVILSHRGDQE